MATAACYDNADFLFLFIYLSIKHRLHVYTKHWQHNKVAKHLQLPA